MFLFTLIYGTYTAFHQHFGSDITSVFLVFFLGFRRHGAALTSAARRYACNTNTEQALFLCDVTTKVLLKCCIWLTFLAPNVPTPDPLGAEKEELFDRSFLTRLTGGDVNGAEFNVLTVTDEELGLFKFALIVNDPWLGGAPNDAEFTVLTDHGEVEVLDLLNKLVLLIAEDPKWLGGAPNDAEFLVLARDETNEKELGLLELAVLPVKDPDFIPKFPFLLAYTAAIYDDFSFCFANLNSANLSITILLFRTRLTPAGGFRTRLTPASGLLAALVVCINGPLTAPVTSPAGILLFG